MELEKDNANISVTLIKPAAIDTMYVEHAKNYLDHEATLPPPIYSPEVVTEAILYAAEHPRRDIFVGAAAKLFSAGSYYMPRFVDKFMERLMFRMQITDKPRDSHKLNALPAPGSHPDIYPGPGLHRFAFPQASKSLPCRSCPVGACSAWA